MTAIPFYFDYISPYAYLAATQLVAVEGRTGCTFEPVPILFAALLNAHGNVGPAEIPAKRNYVMQNCIRLADQLNQPITAPPAHPFVPLLPLRMTAAVPADQRLQFVIEVYRALWADGQAIDSIDAIKRALVDSIFAIDDLIQAAQTNAIKQQVIHNTEQAIQAGVFGVPTVVVNQEIFWGVDGLELAEQQIINPTPLDQTLINQWANIPAAATRKR